MSDSRSDLPPDADPKDPMDHALGAAFPRPATRSSEQISILDLLSQHSGVRPKVTLRDEPSGHGDRPFKPLTGSDLDVPQTAGKYQVQGEIARGGVGAVFKSHDTDLGRDVAMKLLHEKYLDNPDVLRRFVEEAQIGGQLQHPGIVPVYDLGLSGERPYFTMKLIKGRTLASLLEDRNDARSDRRKLLSIFEQVCQTMAYAHSRGVIHRDLKPANVMVGAFGEVQVVDWGMGKVLPRGGIADEARARQKSQVSVIETVRSDKEGSQSIVGSVMGTPAYMPPEQANGAVEQMDERSDVFALGAVLCEILTGVPPYDGPADDRLTAAAKAELGPCHERLDASGANAELVELVRDCLMPVPANRPRDAQKVAHRLAEHFASLEEQARQAQIDAAEQRVKVVAARRSQKLTLALAASVLATVSVASGGYWWVERGKNERTAEAEGAIELALNEASEVFGRAQVAAPGDLTGWAEAVATVERAQALLPTAEVDDALRARVQTTWERYAAARQSAQQRASRQEMVARLETIGLPPEQADEEQTAYNPLDPADCERRDRAYRALFQEQGLPLEDMDPNDASLALDDGRDLEMWIATLDDWALAQEILHGEPAPARLHLLEIAAALDANPVRSQLRDLLFEGAVTRTALEHLCAETDVSLLPPSVVLSVTNRLQQLESHDLAEELLRRAQRHQPDSFALTLRLAQTLADQEPPDHAEAMRFFTAATSLRPDNVQALSQRAHCARQLEWWSETVDCYRQVVALQPDYTHAHCSLGLALRRQGDLEGSVAEYLRAFDLQPDHDHALKQAGVVLAESGDWDRALVYMRRYAEVKPCVAGYGNLGICLQALGDDDGALENFQRALAFAPNDAWSHDNLAWFYATCAQEDLRDTEKALDHARRTTEYDPEEPSGWQTLGAALLRAEQHQAAIESIHRSMNLAAGNDPLNFLLLALAHQELDQPEQARSWYRKALREQEGEEVTDHDELRLLAEARRSLGLDEESGG